jgi:PIN domain nuclease of toxin-antitoxin system
MNAWRVADTNLQAIEEAYSLPGEFHRDPVDRIITATARLVESRCSAVV